MSEPHFVYVIASNTGNGVGAPCKIGITKDLRGRFRQIQASTSCPYNLALFAHIETPGREIATALERAFHATQRGRRLRGEWYALEPEQAIVLMNFNFAAALSSAGMLKEEIDFFWASALTCHGWERPPHWQANVPVH